MDEIEADLDAFVQGEAFPFDDEEPSTPVDADTANMLLRVLRRLERDEHDIDRTATAEIQRIEDWRRDRMSGIARHRASVERALEGWTRATISQNARTKTQSLPNGSVSLRERPASLEVIDDRAFREWAHARITITIARMIAGPSVDPSEYLSGLADRILHRVLYDNGAFLRISEAVDVSHLKKDAQRGPVYSETDEAAMHSLLDAGEPIPGVALIVPKIDSFHVHPA